MKIRNQEIGSKYSPYIIAEIGINHNGSLDIARTLIDIAKDAGCDAVKFQKRTIDVVYSPQELSTPRESFFGSTNGDLKRGLEFSYLEYAEIFDYCAKKDIACFASPWDVQSVDFLNQFNVPCYKVASACITDFELLQKIKETKKPIILSTGMSTNQEIYDAVNFLDISNLAVLSCTSTYPTADQEVNLRKILSLKTMFPNFEIGYSGHETDLLPTILAVCMGASVVERHITLSKSMWGSDQKSSLEPHELKSLVSLIKSIKLLMGSGETNVFESELPIIKKLRRFSK